MENSMKMTKIKTSALLLFLCSFMALFSDIQWSQAKTLFSDDNLTHLKCAYSDSGQGLAVWTDVTDNGLHHVVFYSFYNKGFWSKPEILIWSATIHDYAIAINDAKQAVIAIDKDPGGTPMPTSALNVATYDGEKWSDLDELFIVGDNSLANLKVSIDSNQGAVVAYLYNNNSSYEIQAVSFNGTEWSRPLTITTSVIKESQFDISLHPNGEGVLAWANSKYAIEAKRYVHANWESKSEVLSPSNFPEGGIICTSNANEGHPAVVWTANYRDSFHIDFSYYNERWIPPTSIDLIDGHDLPISLAFDTNTKGDAIIAWGGSRKILRTLLFYPDVPGIKYQLSTSFDAAPGNLSVSINDKANAIVSWVEYQRALMTNTCIGKRWGIEPHALTYNLMSSSSVFSSINQSDQVVANWLDLGMDSGAVTLTMATGSNQSQAKYPHIIETQVSQIIDYQKQGLSHNLVTWKSCTKDEVAAYKIFRNNVFLGRVPFYKQEYQDQLSQGNFVYRVDAIDKNDQVIASGLFHIH